MEFKKEIESLLEDLKKQGYSRRRIELELGYSENYIDQQVSRGGNKRLLTSLEKLKKETLQKATDTVDRSGEVGVFLADLEKRIIVLEAGVEVLVQSLVEERHRSTGRSFAELSLELNKTMKAAALARFDELKK